MLGTSVNSYPRKMSCFHISFLLGLFYVFLNFNYSHQSSLQEAKNLTSSLMNGYFKRVRPIENQSEAIEVDISMTLVAVHDVDEVQQTMSSSVYLSLSWTDSNLVWNETEKGITELVFSSDNVWIPNIVVLNSRKGIENIGGQFPSTTLVKVKSNGLATWKPGVSINIMCPIDVEFFPDDIQTCFITLQPWVYEEKQIKIKSTKGFESQLYEENGVWELKALYLIHDHSAIKFAICIQRLPTFFLVNVLFPVICISVLNILVFKLPPESGEKVSYSITVLLTFTVFLSITSASMPQKSNPMSLLLYYIVIAMMQSVFIILAVLLNLRLYYSNNDNRHSLLVRCVWRLAQKTSKAMDSRHPRVASLEHITNKDELSADKDVKPVQPKICYDDETEGKINCQKISLTIDSILFWLFLVGFSAVTVVFIIMTVRINQTKFMGCKR